MFCPFLWRFRARETTYTHKRSRLFQALFLSFGLYILFVILIFRLNPRSCTGLCVMSLSSSQRRPIPPRFAIPSQLWCKYAGNDDPRVKPPVVE